MLHDLQIVIGKTWRLLFEEQPNLWAYLIGVVSFWFFLRRSPPQLPESSQDLLPAELLELHPDDRLLILAPHPDDEVLGCGGVIQKAIRQGIALHVALLTGGCGRPDRKWRTQLVRSIPFFTQRIARRTLERRRQESLRGGATLGLSQDAFSFLGYPDMGCLEILKFHSGPERKPLRARYTGYDRVWRQGALRPGTPYKAEEVLRDMTDLMRRFNPTKVFVTHPADDHPDHQALYVLARLAAWAAGTKEPLFYNYLIHSNYWPEEHGFSADVAQEIRQKWAKGEQWTYSPVKAGERVMKRKALEAHASQYSQDGDFMPRFVQPVELFNDLPPITIGEGESITIANDRLCFKGQDPLNHLRSWSGSLSLLPWREEEDFTTMPKIHIHFGAVGVSIWNQFSQLPPDAIQFESTTQQIQINIPLRLLRQPTRLFIQAKGDLAWALATSNAWRIIQLPPKAKNS